MTDLTTPTAAIVTGMRSSHSVGLKTRHSLTVAAASDPLAFQVGADLGEGLAGSAYLIARTSGV